MKRPPPSAKRLPFKARPKKPMAPVVPEPIEPVNAPLYPPVEDLYPHLGRDPDLPSGDRNKYTGQFRSMPPVTKWPADE